MERCNVSTIKSFKTILNSHIAKHPFGRTALLHGATLEKNS
jgi:hypothetical protein